MDWDQLFMNMVYLIAKKSKDKSTHIGAVIIGPVYEVISVGYNSFVRGCNDDVPERQERPEKYFWFEHAERNAILNAVRIGVSTIGCTMYTQAMPCMDCARSIVQSGISQVILDQTFENKLYGSRAKWDEHHTKTSTLFKECGVNVRYIKIKPVEIDGLVRGEIINLKEVKE